MGKLIDLIDFPFGRLRVIKRVGSNKHRHTVWKCLCDPELGGCGKVVDVAGTHLQSGNTKSCGCLHREIVTQRTASKNPNWKGGTIKDKDGYIAIHQSDHPCSDSKGYIREHRLVMEKVLGRYLRQEEVCHHFNEIRDDNREENLTVFENHAAHISFHAFMRRE